VYAVQFINRTKGDTWTFNIERFQDDISAIHENAEEVLNKANQAENPDVKSIYSSYSLVLKGQAVLGEMILEVLKVLNNTS
jgi:hypothetical protein